MVLLIPIVIVLTLKRYKKIVANWTIKKDDDEEEINLRAAVIAICVTIVGAFLFRIFINIYTIALLGAALQLFFVSGFCMFAYQLYLLKKYCPDLFNHIKSS